MYIFSYFPTSRSGLCRLTKAKTNSSLDIATMGKQASKKWNNITLFQLMWSQFSTLSNSNKLRFASFGRYGNREPDLWTEHRALKVDEKE